jgi:NAD(P)-dependent dehydrogenase (short-subunit alcohol dehydrogenase family)
MPESKVVLITGASSGFGKETAGLLANRGFRVYGTSRKPSVTAAGESQKTLQLDVDSDESVDACVRQLLVEAGRLDVLVNNAGYVLTGGIEETSVEEAKAQLETIFFGSVRMVKAVLPTMRKQGSGQIINISSIAARLPVPFEPYYTAGKAALLSWSEALRYEVKNFGIRVSVLEPGFFRTNLGYAMKDVKNRIEDYDRMRKLARSALDDDFQKGSDPKIVAETILRIIESKMPRLEYVVGKEKRYLTIRSLVPRSTFEGVARKHWKLDE